MSLENFIKNISEDDLKKLNELFYAKQNKIPIFRYSQITSKILKELLSINKKIDKDIFNNWFNNIHIIKSETILFFEKLIEDNRPLIDSYNEEDLKVNMIIPILNSIHFKSYKNEFRDFYEASMRYETDKFIFNGTTDFVVSKGLFETQRPYFFIQEFKKGEQNGYPEPQLIAELISAVELNNDKEIKGAYIVGSLWFFVILRKLDKDKYEYFVSNKLDSMRVDDLIQIYKNLLFIKSEIIDLITKEKEKNEQV
ncbi:MAG: hypothetical protein QM493_06570 [Sulfurovum sp.]